MQTVLYKRLTSVDYKQPLRDYFQKSLHGGVNTLHTKHALPPIHIDCAMAIAAKLVNSRSITSLSVATSHVYILIIDNSFFSSEII